MTLYQVLHGTAALLTLRDALDVIVQQRQGCVVALEQQIPCRRVAYWSVDDVRAVSGVTDEERAVITAVSNRLRMLAR